MENPIYRFLVLLMYSMLKEVSGKKLRGVLRKTGLKNKVTFQSLFYCDSIKIRFRWANQIFFCDIERIANFLPPSPNFIAKLLLVAENGGFEVSSL